jgi:hypothetical protein
MKEDDIGSCSKHERDQKCVLNYNRKIMKGRDYSENWTKMKVSDKNFADKILPLRIVVTATMPPV